MSEVVSKEDYWQIILNDPSKVGQITTDDEKFNKVADFTYTVVQNTLLTSEDEDYLKKYEEMIDISGEGLTPFQRKVNILYMLSGKNYIPLNLVRRGLINLGLTEFKVEYNKEENKVIIQTSLIDDSTLDEIYFLSSIVLPQNVSIDYDAFPINYTKLDWIQNNSGSYILIDEPYINGYSGCKMKASVTSGTAHLYLWGIWDYSIGQSYSPFFGGCPLGSSTYGRMGAAAKRSDGTNSSYNDIVEIAANWLDNNKMEATFEKYEYVSDNVIQIHNIKSEQQSILAIMENPSSPSFTNWGKFRVYEAKMSQGDKETRHLIPALDELGNPGLYDLKNRKMYFNAGAGVLDYGYQDVKINQEETSTYSYEKTIEYGKLTKYGLQRIYKLPENSHMSKREYAINNGFKEIVETPIPSESCWSPTWHETESQIILNWIEIEEPLLENSTNKE